MDTILCPYCECRVRVSDVDDEGGVCPECGSIITPTHLLEQDREADRQAEIGVDDLDDGEEKHEE